MKRTIEKVPPQEREQYLFLLLMADEQKQMIDRYLFRAELYILKENGQTVGEIAVTDENGVLEIKNLAVVPEARRRGCGRALIEFIEKRYADRFEMLQVGTGDSPLTVPFYRRMGFIPFRRECDFFTRYYDHPIIEAGVTLRDMVYLQKKLQKNEL